MRSFSMFSMSLAAMLSRDAGVCAGRCVAIPLTSGFRLAAGLGMALAAGLCGLGQGKATASATEALARNPGARPGIFIFLILGLAFIESLALFTFVIIFLKVKPPKIVEAVAGKPPLIAEAFLFWVCP